ncbi:anthocyanidin 5,3-O-glucosyltransferase-like [Zingiber officinale]|uniref:Glycosyltransferase n=1 Tax=Zingiber officinale TaxID=94328 RepID=A0A8J5I2V6_ZINOF|nr:anthocyanidin 5,3-O-glucosyltransferase-like [Zingiber officinale]KAG6532806.1 hypothetical protein ZIOFF_006659 [Zingiber officinale]
MKPTVVLYPMTGMGHVVPMVELAKLFLLHDFAVTVVIMHSPVNHPSLDPFLARVSAAYPSISFHRLPPPTAADPPAGSSSLASFLENIRLNNSQLLDFLVAHRLTADVRAVVLDFFCVAALDVTAELRLPTHIFFSSSAASLAIFLYLPAVESTTELSFRELGDAPVHFPGLPPIAASDMPSPLMDRTGESYERLVIIFQRMLEADSIFINSFEPLESETVHALRSGACAPSRRMPEVHCIGPLISGGGDGNERAECLKWLDVQPRGSVVFLCFGSMSSFSVAQLEQIAAGLERSGQRFLWVVRTPKDSPESHELDVCLPEGFLERTKQRGVVVESWAPQVEVLNHEAVAAFVTHCGWNSTLEAIAAGVAMVAWPLYAEQSLNKVLLVEWTGLAVAMEGYEKGIVTAEEVEAKVRWVMESEGGRELRERAAAMKATAAAAAAEGGSSRQALLEIVKSLRNSNPQVS